MEKPAILGRFVCVNGLVGFAEIAAKGKLAFPLHNFPKRRCPNFVLYVSSLCDSRLKRPFLKDNLSIVRPFSNAKLVETLQFHFIPMEKTLIDTFESMFDVGVVERKV